MTEPYVRPDVRAFLDYLNALPGPRTHQTSPAEARAMLVKSRYVADAEEGALAVKRDLTMPGPGGDLTLRLYDARERRGAGPLLVFFHGGGFVLGGLETHDPLCAEIARRLDLPVVAVDYRLAPEHPFPAGIEDANAAARWVAGSPEALGLDVAGLVLAGDSAGGNFAIVTALGLRDDPAAVPVLAQWPIYPAAHPTEPYPSFTEFAEGYLLTHDAMRWFDKGYAPDASDWRYSPMLRDMQAMPPAVVITASLDPIRDQGRAYAGKLAAAGVRVSFLEAHGNIHGFANLRKAIPSSEDDLARCFAQLELLLAGTR